MNETQSEYRSKIINVREVRVGSLACGRSEKREHIDGDDDGHEDEWMITGLAARTETWYEVGDWYGTFNEKIVAGAFKTTLAESPDVSLLVNHWGLPLASTRSGTLRLWESNRGLEMEASLDRNNPVSQQVMSGIERGDITEMSFAFRVVRQVWDEKYENREIESVNLHRGDVSVVNMGANPTTEISKKREAPQLDASRLLVQQQEEELAAADLV